MTYQLTTLENGLRVASETLPGMESVAVTVTCGVGARYETLEENGISHLLEHMAFKGTKTRSARDIAESFDAIGGQLNAYTSMEHTVYYAKLLRENLPLAVDMLGDILQHSVFDPTELSREQGVIVQEIAMHHDTPDDLIVDYFDHAAFPSQPLGRSILGSKERIEGFSRADLQHYMQRYYHPQRMVLSAAGNVQHDELVALARKHFTLTPGALPPACPTATYGGGDARVEGDFEQLHLMLGLPAVSMHHEDYYALQLYVSILGGGMSSRLFQEVREKRGLAYTVYAMGSAYEDVGMMSLYAATTPEKSGELSRVLCEQVNEMAQSITPEEITRAKTQHRAELLMARENPQTVAGWIGRHLMLYNEYRPARVITERVEAVGRDRLISLAQRIASGRLNLAALGDVAHVQSYDALSRTLAA